MEDKGHNFLEIEIKSHDYYQCSGCKLITFYSSYDKYVLSDYNFLPYGGSISIDRSDFEKMFAYLTCNEIILMSVL